MAKIDETFPDDFRFETEDEGICVTDDFSANAILKRRDIDFFIDDKRNQLQYEEKPDFKEDVVRDITTIARKKKMDDDNDEKYEFENVITEFENFQSFLEMKLSKPILKALTEMNITVPKPIQSAAIPIALLGKDICARAKTGSGKTFAFLLPIIEKLYRTPNKSNRKFVIPRALILSPTRELALQIYSEAMKLIKYCSKLSLQLISGGMSRSHQEASLSNGADIIIATPGRLIDLVYNTANFDLLKIEYLVLDEADRMLDDAFTEQITEIVRQCSPTRHMFLFSATMTENVKCLTQLSLKEPVKVFPDEKVAVSDGLEEEIVRVRSHRREDREAMLMALICRGFSQRAIVFLNTKNQCHRIRILLGLLGIRCVELHSNLTPEQRLTALARFAKQDVDVMVCTDVLSRGIDIKGVKTVINFNLPRTHEQYVHRVGRTARNTTIGLAISLVDEDERNLLKAIAKSSPNGLKMRKIDPTVIEFYNKRIGELHKTFDEIIESERIEKESQLAELELQKMEQKLTENDKTEKGLKRFDWFKKHAINKNNPNRKRKVNEQYSDDDVEEDDDRVRRSQKQSKRSVEFKKPKPFSKKIAKEKHKRTNKMNFKDRLGFSDSKTKLKKWK